MTIICACFLTAVSGCATDDSYRRDEVRSMKSDVNEQLTQVKSVSDEVKWQVDEANKRTESVEKELATLKSRIIENNKVIEQKLAELAGSIASVDAKRAAGEGDLTKKIQVILDEVSKENERILSKIEAKKTRSKKESSKHTEQARQTAGGEEGTHTVASGETLSKISRAYGISLNELMEMNGITNPNSLREGQRLKVPKK
jgi:LysM repeat protein